MIDHLPDKMPIFLDKLRLDQGSESERRFMKYLRINYPELENRYQTLLSEGTDPYVQELREFYRDEPRIQFVFGEN